MEEFLTRVKAGSKWMWSLGDYSEVAPLLEACSTRLAEAIAIAPGARVLDVAAGNGNFGLAAAPHAAEVTACDLSPHMVELGRSRTSAAGVPVRWLEADAEELPFDDGSFDVVASVFGAMFAPRPDRVAGELFRVCRPGGVVAMANYGREGFLGSFAELLAEFSAAAPVDLPSPFAWGDPNVVRQRFAGLASSIECEPQQLVMSFPSIQAATSFWERTNGPQIALRTLLSEDRYAEFQRRAESLRRRMNQSEAGGLELRSTYLNVRARK